MAAYEVLLLNTAIPQIQAAQSGDTYLVPRDIAFSAALTLSAGTANGVPYLSSPGKVLTTGSALTFDGTTLKSQYLNVQDFAASNDFVIGFRTNAGTQVGYVGVVSSANNLSLTSSNALIFNPSNSEAMRLTSTGLGIGTTSPLARLSVQLPATSPAGYSAAANSGITLDCGTSTNGVINLVGGGDLGIFHSNSSNAYDVGIGFGNNANRHLTFVTANAERMRLDSSGNLGLGVTPSAWWSAMKPLQMSGNGFIGSASNYTYVGANFFYNSSANPVYVASAAASLYEQGAGGHRWFTAPSGTADGTAATSLTSAQNGNSYTIKVAGTTDFTLIGAANNNVGTTFTKSGGTGAGTGTVSQNISFTQAMTLDASGNLVVGGTSANVGTWNKAITLNTASGNASYELTVAGAAKGFFAADASNVYLQSSGAIPLIFTTNGGERARITSGGDLLVGNNPTNIRSSKFVVGNAIGGGTGAEINNTDSSSWISLAFHTAGTLVGYISNTTTTTAYNTSSDYRLKNNQQPLTGSGAFIDALKPKTWDWKSGGKGVGFIAHEVQAVSPGTVVGEKDAVDADGKPIMQAMEYGSAEFIANIVAELQSLRARVAQLEQGA